MRFYGADPDRVEVVPPGSITLVFSPGDRGAARRELGLPDRPVLLFVGRIQRLKGADLAIGALAELHDPDAELVIVGGPSGPDGDAELGPAHDGRRPRPRRQRALRRAAAATSASSPGTAPPTCASCRRERSRSGSSRSKRRRAARRSWRPSRRPPFARGPREDRLPRRGTRSGRVRRADRMLLNEEHRSHARWARSRPRVARYRGTSTAARLRRLYGDLGARGLVRCDCSAATDPLDASSSAPRSTS